MTCGLMTHGFRGFWLYWHVVLFSNPWYCIIIWFCWRAFTISCTWVVGWPLLFLGLSTLSPCHLPLGFIELLSIRFNCSYRLMCFTRTIDLENCFIRVGQGGKAGRSSGHVTSYFAWAPLAPLPLTSDISTLFQIPMSFLLKVLKDCRFRSSTDRIHFQSGTDCLSFKSRQDCCMSGSPVHRLAGA